MLKLIVRTRSTTTLRTSFVILKGVFSVVPNLKGARSHVLADFAVVAPLRYYQKLLALQVYSPTYPRVRSGNFKGPRLQTKNDYFQALIRTCPVSAFGRSRPAADALPDATQSIACLDRLTERRIR